MCDLDAVRKIVQEENAIQAARVKLEAVEKARAARKWAIGIVMTLVLFLSGGVVKLIQNDTRLKDHTSDGHPAAMHDMVHSVQETLVEIKTTQKHIQEDVGEIKKKLSFRSAGM